MKMPWKLEVQVIGERGKWHRNSRLFATREDAEAHACDLMLCWRQVVDYRAIEIDERVDHCWENGCFVKMV
jgi:hypothetical protein